MIVRLAGYRQRIKTKGQYLIIGDDIVISNDRLASSYKKLLRSLEIEFKESDSFVSTKDRSIAEFAKRLFINGREISPLPLRLLESDLKSEAAFLVRSREIGHQLRFETSSYPGKSNRVELLLLCAYTFLRIRKEHPIELAPFKRITNDYLASIFKEYLETEVGNSSDMFRTFSNPANHRRKIIDMFVAKYHGRGIMDT
jgi:hypothetical protein